MSRPIRKVHSPALDTGPHQREFAFADTWALAPGYAETDARCPRCQAPACSTMMHGFTEAIGDTYVYCRRCGKIYPR